MITLHTDLRTWKIQHDLMASATKLTSRGSTRYCGAFIQACVSDETQSSFVYGVSLKRRNVQNPDVVDISHRVQPLFLHRELLSFAVAIGTFCASYVAASLAYPGIEDHEVLLSDLDAF